MKTIGNKVQVSGLMSDTAEGVEAESKENNEEEVAALCTSFSTCNEAIQWLDMYRYFLSSIPQAPKTIAKSVFELENNTTNLFEKTQTNYLGYVF
jgi:hypothetical protein